LESLTIRQKLLCTKLMRLSNRRPPTWYSVLYPVTPKMIDWHQVLNGNQFMNVCCHNKHCYSKESYTIYVVNFSRPCVYLDYEKSMDQYLSQQLSVYHLIVIRFSKSSLFTYGHSFMTCILTVQTQKMYFSLQHGESYIKYK
jgi:hypothetical protein